MFSLCFAVTGALSPLRWSRSLRPCGYYILGRGIHYYEKLLRQITDSSHTVCGTVMWERISTPEDPSSPPIRPLSPISHASQPCLGFYGVATAREHRARTQSKYTRRVLEGCLFHPYIDKSTPTLAQTFLLIKRIDICLSTRKVSSQRNDEDTRWKRTQSRLEE